MRQKRKGKGNRTQSVRLDPADNRHTMYDLRTTTSSGRLPAFHFPPFCLVTSNPSLFPSVARSSLEWVIQHFCSVPDYGTSIFWHNLLLVRGICWYHLEVIRTHSEGSPAVELKEREKVVINCTQECDFSVCSCPLFIWHHHTWWNLPSLCISILEAIKCWMVGRPWEEANTCMCWKFVVHRLCTQNLHSFPLMWGFLTLQ